MVLVQGSTIFSPALAHRYADWASETLWLWPNASTTPSNRLALKAKSNLVYPAAHCSVVKAQFEILVCSVKKQPAGPFKLVAIPASMPV